MPIDAAEVIELLVGVRRSETRQQINVFHRQKQFVATVIRQMQAIMGRPLHFQSFQTVIARHAVINVNNKIANRETCRFR